MNLTTLISTLGEDADLLTRSEQWLEEERRATAHQMDKLAIELRAIQAAQAIKRKLQQQNLVAVQHLLRNSDGELVDIIIRIMNLPDAMASLNKNNTDELDGINREAQIFGWDSEGYDTKLSASLRMC